MQETCIDILAPSPIILKINDSLREAAEALVHEHVRFLPVVDETGKFQGLFSSLTIIKMLLPQAMRLNMGKELVDLSFMRTGLSELRERYNKLAEEPLMQYITRDPSVICTPDTSIMEILLILHKSQSHAFVVEPDSQKLIGVITVRSVLSKLNSQN